MKTSAFKYVTVKYHTHYSPSVECIRKEKTAHSGLTWTKRRIVMFLNTFPSATASCSFGHIVEADIRGITQSSPSSNRQSGDRQYKPNTSDNRFFFLLNHFE